MYVYEMGIEVIQYYYYTMYKFQLLYFSTGVTI